eukprot:TRINITY_DN3052_c0_g3_i1.p1 TRINITY_DN3052_c0_g3~~TRINITY_DN3052_c0_g3_i1.p1  ORF type:complete len:798 (-),score=164.68 TRINITY_DN3052_c0_g3_i1:227-2620(-)
MTAAPAEPVAAPGVHEREVPGEPDSDKVYLGAVKSYNERRGFGFVACAETSAEFGRDVYMAKIEGQMAAANIRVPLGGDMQKAADEVAEKLAAAAAKNGEKPGNFPRLAEEDLVQFMVKLSMEGFPQAVQVQRLRKYTGVVTHAPELESVSPSNLWQPGCVTSQEVAMAYGGSGKVVVPQEACGQVRLVPGDTVTFCLPQELQEQHTKVPKAKLEAKLVMLASSQRPAGSVLGCCRIKLPRPAASEGVSQPAPLGLDCHAFGSKVILSGLSVDVGESELMRFFSKQGASKVIVAHARGCSFASITFPSMQEVSTFLGRCAHAFADDKETRIATLHSHTMKRDEARLPALPAPTQTPGDEPASILVTWAPLALAVGYVVEIRPAGTKVGWAAVDVANGSLGQKQDHFGSATSSCRVSGLRPGFAYEARVTYYSSCGCRSEASDASQPCTPCAERPCVPHPAHAHHEQGSSGMHGYEVPCPQTMAMHGISPGINYCPPAEPPHAAPGCGPSPGCRCGHGAIVPAPPAPEVMPQDEAGFSVSVRWPFVAHAAAYIVELREAGSPVAERFVRSAAGTTPGSLVELRVGGLRPVPGRTYMAQLRCVAQCGCESSPSAPNMSPPMGVLPPPEVTMAGHGPARVLHQPSPAGHSNPPPPPQWAPATGMQNSQQQAGGPLQIPAGFPYANGGWPSGGGPLPDASPLSVHIASSPLADGQTQGAAELTLAAAMKDFQPDSKMPQAIPLAPVLGSTSGAPLVPPPDAPPGAVKTDRKDITMSLDAKTSAQKELPPEITGQEECIILD